MDQVRIVTRADDLGSYRAANRAILDCCDKGVVRNVSIMVPADHFEEAAEMFQGRNDICVGVHGTVTCEWDNVRWRPVAPPDRVRCILDSEGRLVRTLNEIISNGVRFAEILAELQAQLDRARRRGLNIAYIDGHMVFGWLFEGSDDSRRVSDAVSQWAAREGILYHGYASELGLQWPPVAEGPDETQPQRFAQAVRSAPPGDYIMVTHPAYPESDILQARTGHAAAGVTARERDIERRTFMDQCVLDAFKQSGALPIRFTDRQP